MNDDPDIARFDVFVCHASEDKGEVARPLATELQNRDIRVWIDEGEVLLGDSLRRKIDEGLALSRFGVVVLSPSFFEKQWTQWELDGLAQREMQGDRVVILPVLFDLTINELRGISPSLAGRAAASWDDGISAVADQIERRIRARPEAPVSVGVETTEIAAEPIADFGQAASTAAVIRAGFLGQDGGSLEEQMADAVAIAILSGGNLLVTADSRDMDRAVRVARRVGGLFEDECGPPFFLTEKVAASRGGQVAGGPTTTETIEVRQGDEIVDRTETVTSKPPLVPEDVSVVVLGDVASLNRSALSTMEDLLGPEFGGRPRSMNVWGRITPLPNLRTVVSIADRDGVVAAVMPENFIYHIDVAVDVTRNGNATMRWFEDPPDHDAAEESPELRGPPFGPAILHNADLSGFEATIKAVQMPSMTEFEAIQPAFEALCRQAHWGMQGVLIRIVNTIRARAAAHGRTDATVEDMMWTIRARAAAYEAFTGRHIELPEVPAAS